MINNSISFYTLYTKTIYLYYPLEAYIMDYNNGHEKLFHINNTE